MPFLTELEEKLYESSPFTNKYFVESYYDITEKIDTETISKAREMDIVYDGENFIDKNSAYSFDVYDTLEEALEHHHKRIDKVTFVNLTDEEMEIANAYVKKCVSDDKYLAKYRLTREQFDKEQKEKSEEPSNENDGIEL